MAADSMTFQCIICLDTPKDAVETDCCGQIFCLACIDQLDTKDCPQCRKPELTYHVNWFIRRSVENPTIECPNKCGVKVQAADVKGHLKWCMNNEYSCPAPQCDFKGQRSEFGAHLTKCHIKELVSEASLLFKEVKVSQAIQCQFDLVPFTSNPKFDPSMSDIRNDAGNFAKLGTNGKYYCGIRMTNKCPVLYYGRHGDQCTCVCCKDRTNICGPMNGCNCESCMRLDITSRGLPKGWLVNCVGASAKYVPTLNGTVGWFVCGRWSKYKHDNKSSFGPYCASIEGQSCRNCQYMTEHVIQGLYKVILGIK